MKIKRMDTIKDSRFSSISLAQHGAYLIDDKFPCEFIVINNREAKVIYHDYSHIEEMISDYRFYANHISKFYDKDMKLIIEFDDVVFHRVKIDSLQP